MHCHLYVPDLLSAEPAHADQRFAAAETLIARGRRKRMAPTTLHAWLFERFGVTMQRDWPVAPYTLLADGGSPGRDFWMRADPVHLRVGLHSLSLADSSLQLSRAEADALVEALNRHFGDTLRFDPVQPTRWYVKLHRAPDLLTTPPSRACGEAIGSKLPSGADATGFRALMNEAQMLLHEHPVNTARQARGEPEVNSVWFWGGGVMGAAGARPFLAVFGDDPLTRGLALAAGIPARALPQHAGAMLIDAGAEGVALVALEPPRGAQGRAALERDWLEPLLAALRSGRIGMLTLSLPDANSLLEVETVRSDLRYFWRPRKPLAAYIQGGPGLP